MGLKVLRNRAFGACAITTLFAASIFFCTFGSGAWAADPTQFVQLFGSSERASHDLSQFTKWNEVLQRYTRESALENRPCSRGPCVLQRWRTFLSSIKPKDALRQLEAVNRYVNQTPYQSDMDRYGIADYWATPGEFLGRSGDCEDYAIAKYFSLLHLGWKDRDLRILVLNDEVRREVHAVLIAYSGGTAYVLDNLDSELREHTVITHYRPIFSINEASWYVHQRWNSPGPTLLSSTPTPSTRRTLLRSRPTETVLLAGPPASPVR